MQILELGLAGQHGVHRPQQPVEIEVVAGLCPLLELGLHRVARLRPVGADLGQRQIALRELGAAAVHPVEDVHDDIERLVGAGDFLDMQIDVGDAEQAAEPPDIVADLAAPVRAARSGGSTNAPSPAFPFCITRSHRSRADRPSSSPADRTRSLGFEMEPQTREGLCVAVEELRRLAPHDAIERRHALLAVEQQLHHPAASGPSPRWVAVFDSVAQTSRPPTGCRR